MADLLRSINVWLRRTRLRLVSPGKQNESWFNPNRFSLSYIGFVRFMFSPDHSRPR